jgi:hypothetical protein
MELSETRSHKGFTEDISERNKRGGIMTKVVPFGADSDPSYELNVNMIEEGVAYYKRILPDLPVTVDKSDVTKVVITSETGQ